MADDEVVIDDSTPVFESIEDLHLRSVSAPSNSTIQDYEEVQIDTDIPIQTEGKRRRGRPKGSKNKVGGNLPIDPNLSTGVTGRLAKDVSLRTQQVLKGASSVPAIWRPYFQMHDIEAQNIADPLASYATRKAEISPIVARLVDDFDLVAASIGIIAYGVRVYKDNQDWIKEHGNTDNRGTQRTRQGTMGESRGPIPQSQSTQGFNPAAENGNNVNQPDVEHNPSIPTVSVPYTGDL